jgi:hypothetical protein
MKKRNNEFKKMKTVSGLIGPRPHCPGLAACLCSLAHGRDRPQWPTRTVQARQAAVTTSSAAGVAWLLPATGWLQCHRAGGVCTRRWWEMHRARRVGWVLIIEVPHRRGGVEEMARWHSTTAVVLRRTLAVTSTWRRGGGGGSAGRQDVGAAAAPTF